MKALIQIFMELPLLKAIKSQSESILKIMNSKKKFQTPPWKDLTSLILGKRRPKADDTHSKKRWRILREREKIEFLTFKKFDLFKEGGDKSFFILKIGSHLSYLKWISLIVSRGSFKSLQG